MTHGISSSGPFELTQIDLLTSQLPLPPQQPSQPPQPSGFFEPFRISALHIAEILGSLAERIHRFVRAIFEEILSCIAGAKALIVDCFSSFERAETAMRATALSDPMASVNRAWNASAAPEPSKDVPLEGPQPAAQGSFTQYKASAISRIDAFERRTTSLRDMSLKILAELGARIAALKNIITIGADCFREIGRLFHPQPLSSPELSPLFAQISRAIKEAAADPSKAV